VTRTLHLWWDGRLVGALRTNQHGEMQFAYDPAWLLDEDAPPLSFSLPKRHATFKRRECRPFFAGLLPEDVQRDGVARALGVSRANDFALLDALGGDVAGALMLLPPDIEPTEPDAAAVLRSRPLDDAELVSILDRLPARPLLAGQDGLRLSLAGAQSKLPVVLVDGRIALPAPGQPTTHILKPPIARFPGTTENEAFVMQLAAASGLPTAGAEAWAVEQRPYLLVERYDRRVDDQGRVRRLHQEDICQALGIVPEHKYAAEGGPTFASMFELLRRVTHRPAVAVLALLDAAIFNVIAGNADAHGKNFSLLHAGGVALAPFYDLLCTLAYPDLSPRFAMKVGGASTLEEIGASTWVTFAKDVGMAAPYVRGRVGDLATAARERVSDVVDRLAAGDALDREELSRIAALIRSRALRVAETATATPRPSRVGRRPLRRPLPPRE
jgi:serine/threonine-protein kinase HipA